MSGEERSPSGRKLYPVIPLADRLWARVDKSAEHWLWQGYISSTGYGEIHIGRSLPKVSTHRAAWIVTYGEIPEGQFVCHHCDIRACCRPDHLFLGTCAENLQDMVRKGRNKAYRGMEHAMGRLTDDQVREIRRLVADGVPQTVIAVQYGVTSQFVSQLWRRVRRQYVGD